MGWFMPTVGELKVKRAGKAARLNKLESLMERMETFPMHYSSEAINLAEQIGRLDEEIRQREEIIEEVDN